MRFVGKILMSVLSAFHDKLAFSALMATGWADAEKAESSPSDDVAFVDEDVEWIASTQEARDRAAGIVATAAEISAASQISVEEAVAAITALGRVGESGADAGRRLRDAMQTLPVATDGDVYDDCSKLLKVPHQITTTNDHTSRCLKLSCGVCGEKSFVAFGWSFIRQCKSMDEVSALIHQAVVKHIREKNCFTLVEKLTLEEMKYNAAQERRKGIRVIRIKSDPYRQKIVAPVEEDEPDSSSESSSSGSSRKRSLSRSMYYDPNLSVTIPRWGR